MTKIQWSTRTWNPIKMRCTPVSAGCANCWHLRMAKRLAGQVAKSPDDLEAQGKLAAWTGRGVVLDERELQAPFHWRKPQVVAVQLMGDLFHDAVPDEFIVKVGHVFNEAPRHRYIVLTKRPQRASQFFSLGNLMPWVWLGVSVEDQATADERIPILLQTPAAHRFVSLEPLLGPVLIPEYGWFPHAVRGDFPVGHGTVVGCGLNRITRSSSGAASAVGENGHLLGIKPHEFEPRRLDGVIVGGESGPGARPMNIDWVRSVRDQCAAAGVPLMVKQMSPDWTDFKTVDVLGRSVELPVLDGRVHADVGWGKP